MKVGDLVIDKELGELGIVIGLTIGIYMVRNLITGEAYPVPSAWASDELEVINESR